jgi:prepilin peptidase CpaA
MILMALTITSFHLAILFIAAVVFIAAAVSDVRSYRIPNYYCGLLLLLFPVFAVTSPYPVDWIRNIAVFGIVSAIGFAAFSAHLMGAGDIKLLSVAGLWAGPHSLAVLLLVTAFVGGIESIVAAIALGLKLPKNDRMPRALKAQIPYGVAIATGGVAVLGLMARPILLSD